MSTTFSARPQPQPPPPPPQPTSAYYLRAEQSRLDAVIDGLKSSLLALENFKTTTTPTLREGNTVSVASFLLRDPRLQIVLYVVAKFLQFDLYPIDRDEKPRDLDLCHPFQVWFYGMTEGLRTRLVTSYEDDLDGDVFLRTFEQSGKRQAEECNCEKRDSVYGVCVDNTVEIKTVLVLTLDAFALTSSIETAVAQIQAEEEATKASFRYFVKDRSDDDSLSEHQQEIDAQLAELRSAVFALFDCLLADPFYVNNAHYLNAALGTKCAHPSTLDMRKPFAIALSAADEAAKKEREAAVRKAKEEKEAERLRIARERKVKQAEEALRKAKEEQDNPPMGAQKKKKITLK